MYCIHLGHACLHYRPKWIRIFGAEYHTGDFLLCAKQNDDLPKFSKIRHIIVINNGCATFYVEKFVTTGLCNHLLCYALSNTHIFHIVSALNIKDTTPFIHFLGDRQLYIAMHSDVILC